MLSLLTHLWLNRNRPPFGGKEWFKTWAKRLQQGPNLLKQAGFQMRFKRHGACVDPSAFFSDATMVSGKLSKLKIGAHTFVGRAELAVHATLTIGRCVCINDGAKILTASHDVHDRAWRMVAKSIVIGDYVWIASNALILPGVTLGYGAVVAAGAVVTKDVPPFGIAAGNPAQLMEKFRAESLSYSPTESLALFRSWYTSPPGPNQ